MMKLINWEILISKIGFHYCPGQWKLKLSSVFLVWKALAANPCPGHVIRVPPVLSIAGWASRS